MTTLLVILLFVFMLITGFWIMHRIDIFIKDGNIIDSSEGRLKAGLLIFGSHESYCFAVQKGISCTELINPLFPQDNCCYSGLLILSDDDSVNLSLFRDARASDPDICLIVRCMNPLLKEIYIELGACRVLMPDQSADEVLKEFWRTLK